MEFDEKDFYAYDTAGQPYEKQKKNKRAGFVASLGNALPEIKKWGAFLAILIVSVFVMLSFMKTGVQYYSDDMYTRLYMYTDINVFSIIAQFIIAYGQTESAFKAVMILLLIVCFVAALSAIISLIAGVIALAGNDSKGRMSGIAISNIFINLLIYVIMKGLVGNVSAMLGGMSVVAGPGTGMLAGLITGAVIMLLIAAAGIVVRFGSGYTGLSPSDITTVVFGVIYFLAFVFLLGSAGFFIFPALAGSAKGNDTVSYAVCIIITVVLALNMLLVLISGISSAKKLAGANFSANKLFVKTLLVFIMQIALLILGVILAVRTDVATMMSTYLGHFIVMLVVALAGFVAGIAIDRKAAANP